MIYIYKIIAIVCAKKQSRMKVGKGPKLTPCCGPRVDTESLMECLKNEGMR